VLEVLEVPPSDEADREAVSASGYEAHALVLGHEDDEIGSSAKIAAVRSAEGALREHAATTAPMGNGVGIPPQNDGILRILSGFDEQLLEVLETGIIRILAREWVRNQPDSCLIPRMQELVARERLGERPFLEPKAAADLVRERRRGLGVLSYPWLSASHPDPYGARLRAVKRALEQNPHIMGLFWDFASLPQKPRSEDEEKVFRLGLRKMSDLYASAVGTVVLRCACIPECPPELRDVLRLERTHVDEADIRLAVQGSITPNQVKRIEVMAKGILHVHLATTPSQADMDSLAELLCGKVCDHAYLAYNARPYNDRGWCFFESVVSSELLGRLNPKVKAAIAGLQPKILEVGADGDIKAVSDWFKGNFDAEIARKTFAGRGDAVVVAKLYSEYFERIAKGVASTLHLSMEQEHGQRPPLQPLPPLPPLPSPSFPPAGEAIRALSRCVREHPGV